MEYLINGIRALFLIIGAMILIACVTLRGEVAHMTDDGVVVWLASWVGGVALIAVAILW